MIAWQVYADCCSSEEGIVDGEFYNQERLAILRCQNLNETSSFYDHSYSYKEIEILEELL